MFCSTDGEQFCRDFNEEVKYVLGIRLILYKQRVHETHLGRWAEEGAEVIKDPFNKIDFWALDALEIYSIEYEADCKVDDSHYGEGAD